MKMIEITEMIEIIATIEMINMAYDFNFRVSRTEAGQSRNVVIDKWTHLGDSMSGT